MPVPLGCHNPRPPASLPTAPCWALSAGFARWKIPLVPRAAGRKPWLGKGGGGCAAGLPPTAPGSRRGLDPRQGQRGPEGRC